MKNVPQIELEELWDLDSHEILSSETLNALRGHVKKIIEVQRKKNGADLNDGRIVYLLSQGKVFCFIAMLYQTARKPYFYSIWMSPQGSSISRLRAEEL